ncbi:MAG TPA: hypothetical protein VNH18_20525, partial [Bryobacteraceae bacterium]|nr:hypothetical protein [Bryobacteraceae bacterium]
MRPTSSTIGKVRTTHCSFGSRMAIRVALVLLGAFQLAAGWIQDPGTPGTGNAPGFSITVSPDYSWTQLFTLDENNPAASDELSQLLASLGLGQFLMTGNSAYNYQGTPQLLVIGGS